MEKIYLVFLNGLTYAGLLFMCASGLTLMLGLMRIVNMAHGMYYLAGAFIGLTVYEATGMWWLAMLAGGLGIALLSVLIRHTLFKKVMDGNESNVMLLTVGLNFLIADGTLAIFGGLPRTITPPAAISSVVNVGINYPGTRLFILLVALLQGAVLWFIMYRTKIGQYIRAGVDNRTIVSAMGVNIDKVFTFVFALSGFLVGFSGVIGGSYFSFTAGTDPFVLSYSLIVVIIGGMGSLGGAALGALIVGLLDSFLKYYLSNMSMIVLFGILIIILAIRPNGLMGKESR